MADARCSTSDSAAISAMNGAALGRETLAPDFYFGDAIVALEALGQGVQHDVGEFLAVIKKRRAARRAISGRGAVGTDVVSGAPVGSSTVKVSVMAGTP